MPPKIYKDYSASYFKILDHFSSSKEPIVLKSDDLKAIHSRRRDLHRFFIAIANAENDSYASELYQISRELTISINLEEGTLIIKFNEINDMWEEAFPEKTKEEEKEDKKIKTIIAKVEEKEMSEKDRIIERLKKEKS